MLNAARTKTVLRILALLLAAQIHATPKQAKEPRLGDSKIYRLMKVTSFFSLLLLVSIKLTAQEQVFVREYTYKASEIDSKVTSRAITINQLRSTLLNEIGVYVQSEQLLTTSEVDGKFAQDFVENIATVSAGVTKLEVLDEKWTGETFWMKASITVDKKQFEESLKQLIADRQKVKDLEDVKLKLSNATAELEKLRQELKSLQRDNNSRELEKIDLKYKNEINSLSSVDFFLNGIDDFVNHNYYKAIENYTKAIEIDPKFELAYLHRAFSKNFLKDIVGAIEDLTMAIRLNPEDMFAYYSRGVSKAMIEDYNGAVDDLTTAINSNSRWTTAYYYRGMSRRHLRDYNGAELDQTKVIALDAKFRLAYVDLGLIKLQLHNFRAAASVLTEAIELDPTEGDAYYLRGLSLIDGRKNTACNDFRKAADLGFSKAYEALNSLCN